MPFEWQCRQLGSILRGRGVHHCLLLATSAHAAGATRIAAAASLTKASIGFEERRMGDSEWASVATVDALVREAREMGAQAVVAVGADGVIDAAKAVAVLTRVGHESAEQFLLDRNTLGDAAPPASRLPTVAVLTRPTLTGCSGRCLLRHHSQLVPLRVQGDSGHFDIGPGLPATVEIVDPKHALGLPEGSGRTVEQETLTVGSAALASIVDMRLATAHTIKAQMLAESSAAGVSAVRAVLDNPAQTQIDALLASRAAGMAQTDVDATAYGHVPILHAMACAATGAVPPSEQEDDGAVPYSSLSAALLPAVLRAAGRSGAEAEQEALSQLAEAILDGSGGEHAEGKRGYERSAVGLAAYLDDRSAALELPRLRTLLHDGATAGELEGEGLGGPFAAELVAAAVWTSALVRQEARGLPQWCASIDDVTAIVADAL